jgi:hypothetical protein
MLHEKLVLQRNYVRTHTEIDPIRWEDFRQAMSHQRPISQKMWKGGEQPTSKPWLRKPCTYRWIFTHYVSEILYGLDTKCYHKANCFDGCMRAYYL